VVYGVKGDSVKLIADHDNVLIVENERGERFPVKKALVTGMERQEDLQKDVKQLGLQGSLF
jgi:hypothetical protein